MKKIYFPLVAFLVVTSLSFTLVIQSCKKSESFLASTSTTNLNQTTVFADSAKTMGFLANIYTSIGFSSSANRFGNGGLDAASDEAEPFNTKATDASGFATGTINAGTISNQAYNTCYTNIRAVNQLLANISKTAMKAVNKTQVVAEARFLRAWYYAILLQHYGGVPLVGDSLLTYTTPINVKRATFAATVSYITSECDAVEPILPITQSGLNYGRASGGACLALKARVLLWAASPLFNGTTLPTDAGASSSGAVDPSLVGYPTPDPTRWQLAENAALAVISSGQYSLNTTPATGIATTVPGAGFQGLFTMRTNPECILQVMEGANYDLESLFLPPSRSGGGGGFPYQDMVDAFPMNNGKLITDPTSGYDPANPYSNRDPRFNYTIIHDQTPLLIRNSSGQAIGTGPVNIYNGLGNDGTPDAVHIGTVTGYYHNKMLDPNGLAATLFNTTNRCIPLMRYAEVLLNYAEAANEFEGPTNNVYDAIKSVRTRAGLNPAALPTGLSQSQMRTYIQNERRIELAYEGFRFWDVRRWKIATTTENIQAQGMEVDKTTTSTAYNLFNVTKHNFRPAMYLWPFPLSETGKSPTLVQNPGY
ncbi:MAG: SusD family protein [Mucilaginibacter sp.]|uniref:RagB/SusD family nutrient uptake outer membrane protein n=1 Tax=Mucilaginibacter sp. TaxID=1882438 RepID=UPI00260CB72C|nr:RagB/SusD family nutrient uptake outer membrane protein [Mucilaginibacter sp.]MDB5002502.1 SusD family protein [Mucilaginibacter sp.]